MTRFRTATTAVTLVVAAVVLSGPAFAGQTDRFGMVPSGGRTKILYQPGDSPVHDSVVVYNRTNQPITLGLDVIGATPKPDGSYNLGSSGQGFATDVHLAATTVHLAAKEQRSIGVTIDRPSSTSTGEYAAVTAVEQASSNGPGVGITYRIAVLVGVLPGHASDRGVGPLSGGALRILLTVLAGVLVAVVAAGLLLRRRTPKPR